MLFRRGSAGFSSIATVPVSSPGRTCVTPPSHIICSPNRFRRSSTSDLDESDVEVDVETHPVDPVTQYDATKARNLMYECEKHVNFARPNDVDDDWEQKILRWLKRSTIMLNAFIEQNR